jgi:hypothetical protein
MMQADTGQRAVYIDTKFSDALQKNPLILFNNIPSCPPCGMDHHENGGNPQNGICTSKKFVF